MNNYGVLDLFSGCGGISCGFKMAGFKILGGIDFNKHAVNTFKYNFPEALALNADISSLDLTLLKQNLNQNPDIIVGGPPCQGFSISGLRSKDDPRNKLFYSFANIIEYFKPKVFLMENVPGILSFNKGQTKEEIINIFENIGFKVSLAILNSADYGVPQFRKRVFFIGLRERLFEFPQATHGNKTDLFSILKPYVTCGEAWEDIPILKDYDTLQHTPKNEGFCEFVQIMRQNKKVEDTWLNHDATKHTVDVIETVGHIPDGGSKKDLPEHLKNKRSFKSAFIRYSSKKPSFTIDTGHRHFFHYKFNRVPTVRENARLQSFPDSFYFTGTKTQQEKQVGNAVPPLLIRALAQKIKEYL